MKRRKQIKRLAEVALLALAALGLAWTPGGAMDAGPEEVTLIVIGAEGDDGFIRLEENGTTRTIEFDTDDIHLSSEGLVLCSEVWIGEDAISVGGIRYDLGELVVEEVRGRRGRIEVEIANRLRASDDTRLRSRRALFALGRDLNVDSEDFIYGDVICFGGDVYVDGEVRRNVVVLGGDIDIAPQARVHGDVVAIAGRIYLDRDGKVEGEVLSDRDITRGRAGGARYEFDWDNESVLSMDAYYNRVDGGSLTARLQIADPDSVLPTFFARAGRAFMPGRWDYELGARQRFFDSFPITIGGSFFRQSTSDDYWLAPRDETTVLSLLAAEDYADYYIEKGARGFLTIQPERHNEIGAAYRFTELAWQDHFPNLWHLFDAHKQFRPNFSTLPDTMLSAGMNDFGAKLGELIAWYELNWVDDEQYPEDGVIFRAEYRKAGEDLKGDLSYERYTAELQRFQPLERVGNLNVRVKYGSSEGDLPLFRKFYLGGARTIRGIDHKSLVGDQMVLANIEYAPRIPFTDFQPALFYDIGKTLDRDSDIIDDGEFSSAVGLRIRLGEDLRVDLAKSLDDSDADAKIWVTIGQPF